MGQSGTLALKSFQTFQINDALLTKVVEAVKAGEKEARSTGNVQSFEVFYKGFRQNICIGKIYVLPAKIADKLEGFPVALLYGTLVKIMGGEELSDLISHRIGDNEFDEYSQKDMALIKDLIFKKDGKFESLVLFAPSWINKREYVSFHFDADETKLANLLRHLVFSAYYDPRLSSAFDAMATDITTDKVDVTDITPKLPFPELTANPLKAFPVLNKAAAYKVVRKSENHYNVEEDGKPVVEGLPGGFEARKWIEKQQNQKKSYLTFKNAAELTEDMLAPEEVDVIQALDIAVEHAMGVKTPEEAGKENHGEGKHYVPRIANWRLGKAAAVTCPKCGTPMKKTEDGKYECGVCKHKMGGKEACAEHEVPSGVSNVGPGTAAHDAKKNPPVNEKKFNADAAKEHETEQKPLGIELNADGTPKRASKKTAGTISLANNTQVWLYKFELEGQMSDGMWENSSPYGHYKDLVGQNVTVGEPGLTSVYPRRTYGYRRLVQYVGERMLALGKFSKAYPNVQPEYNVAHGAMELAEAQGSKLPDYAKRYVDAVVQATGDDPETIRQKIEAANYKTADLMRDLRQIEMVVNGAYKARYSSTKLARGDEHMEYNGHDFVLHVWEERDRLNIRLEDECCDREIINVWDDDARSMFEDGFFDSRNLIQSVVEYAESVGLMTDIVGDEGEGKTHASEGDGLVMQASSHWRGTQLYQADARSERSRQIAAKREAKLNKLRPSFAKAAEKVPDADDILSEVLMDIGQPPLVDIPNDQSTPSQPESPAPAMPKSEQSQEPEQEKAVSESETHNAEPESEKE